MTAAPHDHVTLDEDVFHAYQDLAEVVRHIIDGDVTNGSLGFYYARLREALDASHAAVEADPSHHVSP